MNWQRFFFQLIPTKLKIFSQVVEFMREQKKAVYRSSNVVKALVDTMECTMSECSRCADPL